METGKKNSEELLFNNMMFSIIREKKTPAIPVVFSGDFLPGQPALKRSAKDVLHPLPLPASFLSWDDSITPPKFNEWISKMMGLGQCISGFTYDVVLGIYVNLLVDSLVDLLTSIHPTNQATFLTGTPSTCECFTSCSKGNRQSCVDVVSFWKDGLKLPTVYCQKFRFSSEGSRSRRKFMVLDGIPTKWPCIEFGQWKMNTSRHD